MRRKDEIKRHLKIGLSNATLGQIRAGAIQDSDVPSTDLGLDSLNLATTLLEVERWLGIRTRDDNVDSAGGRTVEQLADLLYKRQSP